VTAPILLIGAGRMGTALLRGWIANAIGPLVIVEPKPSKILRRLNVSCVTHIEDAPAHPRAVVVALKPQVLNTHIPLLARFSKTLIISIAAGTSTARFSTKIGAKLRIVRAMPNTPGSVGRGITALYAPKSVSKKDRALATKLLAGLGETVWVKSESQIDVVTAVSGSGPAYVFYMIEALADAGCALGLPRPLSNKLARATIVGSGALLDADKAIAVEILRHNVTSPGGTTEAALRVLSAKDGLSSLMRRAVGEAFRRAKQLDG